MKNILSKISLKIVLKVLGGVLIAMAFVGLFFLYQAQVKLNGILLARTTLVIRFIEFSFPDKVEEFKVMLQDPTKLPSTSVPVPLPNNIIKK